MQRPVLRGIVFDMDGTLTVPNLDFKEMYKRCNVDLSEDLIRVVNARPPAQKEAAWKAIDMMEEEGRNTLKLMRGTVELATWLGHHNIRTGLVTRNSSLTLDHFRSNLWKSAGLPPLDIAFSRCDEVPAKPDPTALNLIAKEWGVDPGPELIMIGDSPSNDVAFGKAAGATTVLLDTGRRFVEDGSDGGADICVESLFQLPSLLWQRFEIEGDLGGALKKYPIPTPTTSATIAAANGDMATLRSLSVDQLRTQDETGNTPLIYASDQGNVEAVELLLTAGVDVNVRGYLGATACCRASRAGHLGVLKALMKVPEIDCNVPNDKLQYPLHFAAFKIQPKAVELLLEHGASTIVLDRKGRTPAEDTKDETIRNTILAARDKHFRQNPE
ncbi:hypothetical protein CYMTET_18732 [Cymbomonas tetramitiformis]|uniref:Uncharacterized protein n=1 Tax=Cymbomonas tetramitiformis TaxID=36881 RepID=A0AAE0L5M2_9CHLO|nr:hypothetical protein CYMTET_18732 [Cymbomonas tetramitiformis]